MTDDDADPVAEAREEVIAAMARSADIYGVKRSYGRLYGILFFAEDPLSMDELTERSEYAKSTVSTAMGALEQFHLVHRRSVPGEGKKAYFEAERDFWHVTRQLLDGQMRREISIMTRALDSAAERLEDADDGEFERERVDEFRTTYARAERLVDWLTSQRVDTLLAAIEDWSDEG